MYQLRESTKIRCGHCNIVAYCSTECLFSTHKAGGDDCNDLGIGKIVMRAANILSQAYLTVREHTWDGQAVKIGLIGNECAAYGNINITSTVQLFGGILDTLMTDASFKGGILCSGTFQEPLAYMHGLVAQLLLQSW
jgi:hypothetical protein